MLGIHQQNLNFIPCPTSAHEHAQRSWRIYGMRGNQDVSATRHS